MQFKAKSKCSSTSLDKSYRWFQSFEYLKFFDGRPNRRTHKVNFWTHNFSKSAKPDDHRDAPICTPFYTYLYEKRMRALSTLFFRAHSLSFEQQRNEVGGRTCFSLHRAVISATTTTTTAPDLPIVRLFFRQNFVWKNNNFTFGLLQGAKASLTFDVKARNKNSNHSVVVFQHKKCVCMCQQWSTVQVLIRVSLMTSN